MEEPNVPVGGDQENSEGIYIGKNLNSVVDITNELQSAVDRHFDFICVPLVHPRFRRCSFRPERDAPFTRSDLVFPSHVWTSQVMGKLSTWLDFDSPNTYTQRNSEKAFQQECKWAQHLSIPSLLAPTPSYHCVNYARCVNTGLAASGYLNIWVKVPLVSRTHADDLQDDGTVSAEVLADPWEAWNRMRNLCQQNKRLGVALEITAELPSPAARRRWLGEPLRAAYINTKAFVVNKNGYPVLTKAHQQFLLELFEHNIQVIIAGHSQFADGLVPYQYYIRYLFNSRRVKTQQEQMEQPYRDYLQSPLQPLSDHLESQTYETFERDPIKYAQYEEAVYQALMDRFSADETAVLMVVGAGRGPLVKASLRASARAQRKLRVYAVEKNPNAVVTLRNMKMIEWGEAVTVVSHDMRTWQAPEKADILVSELLGSFGDNELSPECLDGAQKFLKDDGISIPCNSVSYIAPMSSAKLWSEVQGYNDLKHFETSYVVKLHNFDLLAPPQPCFRFVHPNEKQFPADYQDITPQRPDYNTLSNAHFIGDKKELTVLGVGKFIPPPQPRQSGKQANDNKHDKTSKSTHTPTAPTDASTRTAAAPGGCIDNSRYQRFRFKVEQANTLHGFAGYFDSRLYKDVHISIYPDTFSPGMFSWFPLYFPLRCPIHIPAGTTIEVHFWRVVSSTKVWFEWCVTTPTPSAIHNAGGRSSHIGLAF